MATPCTNSLGGESGGQKHEGDDEGERNSPPSDLIAEKKSNQSNT